MTKRIVAEVSKNWPAQDKELVSEKFEHVIAVNAKRGYELESWQFTSTAVPPDYYEGRVVETIIAVFTKSKP